MSEAVMRLAGDGGKALPRRVAFTQANVERATCPAGKPRTWLYDAKQPGLALMVTGKGAKAFYTYRKVDGRPQRVRLGAFPAIGVEQARKLAQKTLAAIAAGGNPMAMKREAKAKGLTLGELWTWFLANHAKPRKRSWLADQSRYDTHLKPWAARRLADITRADVSALLQRVATAASQTTSNRVLALLSVMFSKAPLIGWTGPNPCEGVSRFREQSRERFLSAEEMAKFLAALDDPATDADWRDFFLVCLLCGARRGNVLALKWDEIDLAAGRWLVPGVKFKNGQAGVVYLPAPVVEILASRKGSKSEWVFPGIGQTGHLTTPTRAWKSLVKRAGLSDLRIHDLRRSVGSWMAQRGASLPIIGQTLGHKSVSATKIYARLTTDAVRASVDEATSDMLATAEPGKAKPSTSKPAEQLAPVPCVG